MRAAVLDETASIEAAPLHIRDVHLPEPGPGELRVSVTACAVCRTDLHVIEGDLPRAKRPVIPGHQVVGVVDRRGDECSVFDIGDRVGIGWLRNVDGTCKHCVLGRENLCPQSSYTGYHADGGYAQFTVVPESFAYALPDVLDDVTATPLLCAGLIGYRALSRANVPDDGRLLLVGFGSSAHIVLQIALHRGYETMVVTRTNAHVEMARQMGAAWSGCHLTELPGPVDSAILFAPVGDLVPPIMNMLDRGGTLAIAGIHLTSVPALDYERHLFYDKQIRSVTANTRADGRELLQEAVRAGVEPRVTTYELSQVNRALQDLKQSRLSGTGVIVM